MKSPQLARFMILLASTILTYFGLGTLMNLGSHPDLMVWFVMYTLLAFVESAILLFCYFRLKTQSKKIFWLTIIILGANIIATIFDQVGIIDIIFMLINLIALIALYLSRKEFLPA